MGDQQASATALEGDDLAARREAARLMGQVRTDAKATAARENGKRGGRPKGIPMSDETRRKISEAKRARAVGQVPQAHARIETNP